MNTYYLIDVADLDEARKAAPATGLPHELSHYSLSEDGQTAIVQAEWTDVAAMDGLGIRLGAMLPNGQVEQAVYDYLASAEWTETD